MPRLKPLPPPKRLAHANSRAYKPIKPNKCRLIDTGAYIEKQSPEIYQQILQMLADDSISFKDIKEATGVTWPTLRAIYEREAPTIDKQRTLLLSKVSRTLRGLVEHVEDQIPFMRPRDAIFGVSVFADKQELLSGNPTQRTINFNVGSAQAIDLVNEFRKYHEAVSEKIANATTVQTPEQQPLNQPNT